MNGGDVSAASTERRECNRAFVIRAFVSCWRGVVFRADMVAQPAISLVRRSTISATIRFLLGMYRLVSADMLPRFETLSTGWTFVATTDGIGCVHVGLVAF